MVTHGGARRRAPCIGFARIGPERLVDPSLAKFPRQSRLYPLPWGLGRNNGSSRLLDVHLLARLQALHEQHGRKVSIVGWSMGGHFARALARKAPAAVRQVITLGSPFTGDPKASNRLAAV